MSNDRDWREEEPHVEWSEETPQIDWRGLAAEKDAVMKYQSSRLTENHLVRKRRSWAFGILWVMLFGAVTSFAVIEGYQTHTPEQVVVNEIESWMIIDERGIIRNLSFPMAHLLGCYPPQLVGQPLSRLLPEEYRLRHYDAFASAIHDNRKGLFVVRAVMLSYDGKRKIPVEVRARVFMTSQGACGKATINRTDEIVVIRGAEQ